MMEVDLKRCNISSLPISVINCSETPSFCVKLDEYQKWALENISRPFSLCHEKVCQSLTSVCTEAKCDEKGNIPTGLIFLHILKLSSELKLFDTSKALTLVEAILVDIFREASVPKDNLTKALSSKKDLVTVRNSERSPDHARLRYVCSICEKTENSEELFHRHVEQCHRDQINSRSYGESRRLGDRSDNGKSTAKAEMSGIDLSKMNSESLENHLGCEDSKPILSGSSKRKRKLPVQYITSQSAQDGTSDHKREHVSKRNGMTTQEDFDEHLSIPAKYSILEADNKKTVVADLPARVSSYPAYPDVDDETPRPVEPQPKTTICYKPSPDMNHKSTKEATEKVQNPIQVAEIVRKMQENCEDQEKQANCNFANMDFPTGSQNCVPNVTIGQTYNLDLFRRLAGKAQVKYRDMERPPKQFTAGFGSKAHDPDSSSAWLKWMMTTSLPQRNCLGEQLSPESATSVSPHQLVNRCGACNEQFSSTDELFQHYQETHGNASQTTAGDQQFKVMWLKQVIPKYLTTCSGGCVSRDELLERTAGPGAVDTSDTSQWGPSCNKAVREIFPESQALRKGKYKKTYYFGVRYSSQTMVRGDVMEEDFEEDVEKLSSSALRNMTQDVEKLSQHIQSFVRWTGHMDDYLTRDTVLQILGRRLGEADVQSWGLQCNRAMRQVFPEIFMKRKGKFKATCYYGVELITNNLSSRQQPQNWSKSSSGPPVVNVRDIMESALPAHMSRFKPKAEDLSTTSQRNLKIKAEVESVKSDSGSETCEETKDNTHLEDRPIHSSPTRSVDDHGNAYNSDSVRWNQFSKSPPPLNTNCQADIEKLILLHPGPFVTARIFSRRFQKLVPYTDRVIAAMTMLQSRGLGQIFTLKQGNSKVFFKAPPSRSLEVPMETLGVRLTDYEIMIKERDPKLEDSLHEKLKLFYPNAESLSSYYKY